ncbi:glycosyltransferase family 2 protein [Candidatus Woesebacteria bacterium]|nr:glycosyltransferase family 2 protein [Candidatus Woesebacteria bacterium]
MKSRHTAGPVASAILAVYNSDSTVEACLKSLLSQSVPIEIIIVDDGSTDTTTSILRSIEVLKNKNIKVFQQKHGGPALARNLGASHAISDILLFADADMIFDKDYVKDLIEPIQKGEVVGTYTTEERVANWDNVWARCWNIQEGWEDGKRFPKNPPKYGTDFRAILKSEFDRVGGFDHIGYTDTWSLFNKLGVRPLSTQAICYHKNPDTLSAVFRQARWSAKRPYKHGLLGTLYAILRTSLPVSLVVGLAKFYKVRNFVIFKIVYDFGRFMGIFEMLLTGKLSK